MLMPLFVTTMDDVDDGKVTLWVRIPGDRDYFVWGVITENQRRMLAAAGVFWLTDDTFPVEGDN